MQLFKNTKLYRTHFFDFLTFEVLLEPTHLKSNANERTNKQRFL